MLKYITIHVSGKVQGVFFRASTKAKAEELKIVGTVRNERDGGVLIEAAGDEEALRQFVTWCRHGPPLARVDHCKVKEGEVKNFAEFKINPDT